MSTEDELRKAVRLALAQWAVVPLGHLGYIADAVLALPEVAALLADAERVRRARAEVDAWGEASREWYYEHRHDSGGTTYACGFEDGWNHAEECIGRALDGDQ